MPTIASFRRPAAALALALAPAIAGAAALTVAFDAAPAQAQYVDRDALKPKPSRYYYGQRFGYRPSRIPRPDDAPPFGFIPEPETQGLRRRSREEAQRYYNRVLSPKR